MPYVDVRLDGHHRVRALADRAGLTRSAIPTAYPLALDDPSRRGYASMLDRFWANVRVPPLATLTVDCWRWTARRNENGYGKFSVGPRASRRELYAHRMMLVLVTGRDGEGLEADHTCSNGGRDGCVSPFHLRWLPYEENLADANRRRWPAALAPLPGTDTPREEIPF